MRRSRPHGAASEAAARLVLVVAVAAMGSPPASAAAVDRRLEAMGTRLEVVVEAPTREASLRASEAAVRAVSEVESRLSTWRPDSELARVNRAPVGIWIAVSPALAADLAAAVGWWSETEGAFHPGLASLMRAWDLRGAGRVPAKRERAAARAAASMDHLELDGLRVRRLDRAFGIEEGGFGKGVALRDAAAAALAAGADCVAIDLGGQLHLAGACGRREVAIADPDARGRSVATLALASGSMASSGNSERGVVVDGRRFGHLLDPRTGRPADDFGSVTVVARDPVAADCAATALFVLGPEDGLPWVESRDDIEAIFVVRAASGRGLLATGRLAGAVAPAPGVTMLQTSGPRPRRDVGRLTRQGGRS